MSDINTTRQPTVMSMSQLARRDGVTVSAVIHRVRKFEREHGFKTTRSGREVLVDVAEFDRLRAMYGDPSKVQAPQAIPGEWLTASDESYAEALRLRTWAEAENKRVQLALRKGELVKTQEVAHSLQIAGSDIAGVIERIASEADDLAVIVAREGSHGLRVALKKMAARMCNEVADVLAAAAAKLPAMEDVEAA